MIVRTFIPPILSFKSQNAQSDNFAALKNKTLNQNRIQQDCVCFTSNNQNKIDINDDMQLIKYMQEQLSDQVNIDSNSFLLQPDFLKNVRKFLQENPDFEQNPPKFRLKAKYKSEKEGKYTLFGTPKNSNINTQIWFYSFQEYNDPLEMMDMYEEKLLEYFDKENYENIHDGIKLFFETNIHSHKEDYKGTGLGENVRIVTEQLKDFLFSNAKDETFVSFLNSKSPEQVNDFLNNGVLVVNEVFNDYVGYMNLMKSNNNPYGLKNVIEPLFQNENFRLVVGFWLKAIGEDISQVYTIQEITKRLLDAYYNDEERSLILEQTINAMLRYKNSDQYVK